MKIAVIDYGASNLKSVANALTALGRSFEIVKNPKRLVEETTDLLYHLFVLLAEKKVSLEEVESEIKKRQKITYEII